MREPIEMSTRARLLTAEEFERMPDEDGVRTELVRGRIVRMTPAGTRHGLAIARIMKALLEYEARTGNAAVLAPSGFVIARGPDTVREPDVAVVVRHRFDKVGAVAGFFPGPPDIAVEVVSPSQRPAALEAKVADYLACGVRMVWVADPIRRSVTVYEAAAAPSVLESDGTLHGGDVLPGFACKVASLFA